MIFACQACCFVLYEPIANVRVSDGRHVVKTDENGADTLPGDSKSRFVAVTTPSGCWTEDYMISLCRSAVRKYFFASFSNCFSHRKSMRNRKSPRGLSASNLMISENITENNNRTKSHTGKPGIHFLYDQTDRPRQNPFFPDCKRIARFNNISPPQYAACLSCSSRQSPQASLCPSSGIRSGRPP